MLHNCYNLKSIDVSHFNIKQHVNFNNMFSGCFPLTSVYFTKTKNNNLEPSFKEMFYDCPNLNYVDISLNNGMYASYYDLFNKNISSNVTIVLNKNYYNKFKKELMKTFLLIGLWCFHERKILN